MSYRLITALCCSSLIAIGFCQAVSAAEPQADGDGYERAVAYLHEGIIFEAIRELEQFTRIHPEHEAARMLLARSLYRVKRDQRAAEELSHVIRVNPDNDEARRLLTRLRVEIGQRLDQKDRDAVLRYARLCAIPDSYDRAADYYRLALELENDAPIHLEFARMLSWAGRYVESAYHYEKFLEFSAANADVLFELGRVYNASRQFEKAVRVFKQCLEQRPDNVTAALDLARSLIWAGREAEAADRLHEMIEKQMGGETPLYLLSNIARFKHQVVKEYNLLIKVLEMNPEHGEAKARLTELERGHRLEEARLLDRLEANANDVKARRQLADLYIGENRLGDALYQLNQIREIEPDNVAVMNLLHEIHREETERVMAQLEAFQRQRETENEREITRLTDWIKTNPDDMKSRLLLAQLYLESGRYDASMEHLSLLSEKLPMNIYVQEMLSRVKRLVSEREIRKEDAAASVQL